LLNPGEDCLVSACRKHKATRALVISPHSDDAAFSCALTISNLLTLGLPVMLLTVFSRSSYQAGGASRDPDIVSAIRKREDEAFVSLFPGGVSAEWLDYPDAPLRGKSPRQAFDARLMNAEDRELAGRLSRQLPGYAGPDDIVIAPSSIGSHIDHRISSLAALRLRRTCALFLYEDMPYAASYDSDAIGGRQHSFAARFGAKTRPVAATGTREFKRQAALCYPSQLNPECLGSIESHRERLWEIEIQVTAS